MGGLQGLQYAQNLNNGFEEKKKEMICCLLGLQCFQSFLGLRYTQSFHGGLEDKSKKETMGCRTGLQYVQNYHGQSEEKRKKEILGCCQGLQYVQSFQGLQYGQSCHGQSKEKREEEIFGCFQGLHYVQSFQGLQYGQNSHGRFKERREKEIMSGLQESQKPESSQRGLEGKRKKEIMGGFQGLKKIRSFEDRSEEKRKNIIMGNLKELRKAQSFQDRSEEKRKDLKKAQSFQDRAEEKRTKKIMGSSKDLQKAQSFQDRSEERRRKTIMDSLKGLRKAQSFQDRTEVKIKKETIGSQYVLCPFDREKKEIIDGLQALQFSLSFHFPFEEKKNKEIISSLQGSQCAQDFHGQSEKEKMGGLLGSENALSFHGLPEENLKEQIIGRFKRLQYSLSFHGRSEEKGKMQIKRDLQFALSFQDRPSSSTIYPAIDAIPEHEALEILLCAELNRLQGIENYLSTGWLRQALDLCLSMHRELQDIFPQIRPAVLRQKSKWMDETLDDTVKLLDVCNALREKMRDIKQCQEKLHLVLRCFNGRLGAWQLAMARRSLDISNESLAKAQSKSQLEKCSSMLRRMGEKRVASSAGVGLGSVEPIHAVKDFTVFVCGLLTVAFSTKSRRSLPLPCAGHSAWACALQNLHFKAKKELERRKSKGAGRVFLDELHAVESSRRALYHLLASSKSVPLNEGQDLELRQSALCLKNCVAKLEDGMASLESRINELFKVVIANRMALLDALTYA